MGRKEAKRHLSNGIVMIILSITKGWILVRPPFWKRWFVSRMVVLINDMFPFHSPSRVGWEDPFHPSISGFLRKTDYPFLLFG